MAKVTQKLYVANAANHTVSIIDLTTSPYTCTVITQAQGSFLVPVGCAVNKDNTILYVANYSNSTVSVVDLTNNSFPTAVIPQNVGQFNMPGGCSLDKDQGLLYVTNYNDNTVSIINLLTNPYAVVKITQTEGNFYYPWGCTLNAKKTTLYVTNEGDNTISVVDVSNSPIFSSTVIPRYPCYFGDPTGCAVNRSETTLYVACAPPKAVYVANLTLNPPDCSLILEPTVSSAYSCALNSEDNLLYVANYRDNNISIVDLTKDPISSAFISQAEGRFAAPQGCALYEQCLPIPILPTTLAEAKVGNPYSTNLTAPSATTPVSNWTISTGSLPTGLTLNSSTGLVSGTPTTAGTFPLSIMAIDAEDCPVGPVNYTLLVTPTNYIPISPATLRAGTVNESYNVTFTAPTGTQPINAWNISNGGIPAGLTLHSYSGKLMVHLSKWVLLPLCSKPLTV
jgi:DNA-binding beta-propeller fold protein YncE